MDDVRIRNAVIAQQAHANDMESRLAALEAAAAQASEPREAMDMPHTSERKGDRGEEDKRREAAGDDAGRMAEEDGHRTASEDEARTAMRTSGPNPKKIPYNKDQTGMFTSPKESSGGSIRAAMEMLPTLAQQRAYAAHPSLTAGERSQAEALIAEMHEGKPMTPEDRLKEQKLVKAEQRVEAMEQGGRTQLAQMGASTVGVFGRQSMARTQPLEARVAAMEEVIMGVPATRARVAAVADYAREQGLDPEPFMAVMGGRSPAEIDALNDPSDGGSMLPGGARTAALREDDVENDGMFELEVGA